jgi:tRNA threonylcarbamoyladenosine biosynthesis protein TsaB
MRKACVLVIDGSGGSVFCGILDPQNHWRSRVNLEGGPLEKLFPAVDAVLDEAGLGLSDLGGFYYCEGPGSVLGLRLCAMAIETWVRLYPKATELYAYNSLQLCAHSLLHGSEGLETALIVADWKKGAWNALKIENAQAGTVEVCDDAALLDWKGPLYHLPQRKGWQAPPRGALTLTYDPGQLSDLNSAPTLLRQTDSVELYNSGINTFQKWTAERHRA